MKKPLTVYKFQTRNQNGEVNTDWIGAESATQAVAFAIELPGVQEIVEFQQLTGIPFHIGSDTTEDEERKQTLADGEEVLREFGHTAKDIEVLRAENNELKRKARLIYHADGKTSPTLSEESAISYRIECAKQLADLSRDLIEIRAELDKVTDHGGTCLERLRTFIAQTKAERGDLLVQRKQNDTLLSSLKNTGAERDRLRAQADAIGTVLRDVELGSGFDLVEQVKALVSRCKSSAAVCGRCHDALDKLDIPSGFLDYRLNILAKCYTNLASPPNKDATKFRVRENVAVENPVWERTPDHEFTTVDVADGWDAGRSERCWINPQRLHELLDKGHVLNDGHTLSARITALIEKCSALELSSQQLGESLRKADEALDALIPAMGRPHIVERVRQAVSRSNAVFDELRWIKATLYPGIGDPPFGDVCARIIKLIHLEADTKHAWELTNTVCNLSEIHALLDRVDVPRYHEANHGRVEWALYDRVKHIVAQYEARCEDDL